MLVVSRYCPPLGPILPPTSQRQHCDNAGGESASCQHCAGAGWGGTVGVSLFCKGGADALGGTLLEQEEVGDKAACLSER